MITLISKDYLMDHVVDVKDVDGTYQEAVLLRDIYDAPTIEYDEVAAKDTITVTRCRDCFMGFSCKAREFYGEDGYCSIGDKRK